MPKSDILLVLDLDRTQIRTFEPKEKKPERTCDFRIGDLQVYKRPRLDDFLNYVKANFILGVWSQGRGMYVDDIVENLFQKGDLDFQWCYDKCSIPPDDLTAALEHSSRNLRIIKDINLLERKLVIPLSKIIMIDDQPLHYLNHDNLIQIKEWNGEESDNELTVLKQFLSCLVNSKDVRNEIKYYKTYRDFCASVKSA